MKSDNNVAETTLRVFDGQEDEPRDVAESEWGVVSPFDGDSESVEAFWAGRTPAARHSARVAA